MIDILYIVLVAFMAVGLAYTNSWHWKERDAKNKNEESDANTKWHRWQYWGVLAPVFINFIILTLLPISVFAVLLSIPLWWILFDGVVAKRLGKKWWYVGNTATVDKILKKPIAKILLLVIVIGLYVIDKIGVI